MGVLPKLMDIQTSFIKRSSGTEEPSASAHKMFRNIRELSPNISEQIGYVNFFHCKIYEIEYRSKVRCAVSIKFTIDFEVLV